jgi:hypothetical protein
LGRISGTAHRKPGFPPFNPLRGGKPALFSAKSGVGLGYRYGAASDPG